MNREITEQDTICAINSMLLSFELAECLDKLKETNLYRHELKIKLKQIYPILEKYVEHLTSELWGKDDQSLYALMEGRKNILKQLAVMRPEDIVGFSALAEEYYKAPDLILNKIGVTLLTVKED